MNGKVAVGITVLFISAQTFAVYSPSQGRFTSRDPIEEEGGLNLYAFCENDPINYVDFLGNVRYKGKSKKKNEFYYKFEVEKCEIAIIYGHGHPTLPHEIVFDDAKDETPTSCAYFWACYPDVTNKKIPTNKRLVEDVGPHRQLDDSEVSQKLKQLHGIAKTKAEEICDTDCCKDGVWIRYAFAPHETIGGKITDRLKGYSSYNKPKDVWGKDAKKWEGDTHVPCKKKK